MIKWGGLWANLCICAGSRLDMLCIQGCYSPDLPWLTVAFLRSPTSLLSEQGIRTITSAKWNAPEVSKLLWKKWTLITFWTVKMCFIWGEAQLKRNYCSPVPTESREVFVITPQEHCNFFFQGRDSDILLTYVQKDTGWVSLLPPRSTTPTNEIRGKLLKMFPERVHSDEIKTITNARIH